MAITEKNLGRTLSTKETTESNIQRILDDCLFNDILKKNAENYSVKINQWDTLARWNQFLNQFKSVRKTIREIA